MRFTTRLTIGYSLAIMLSCSRSMPGFAQDSPGTAAFKRLDKNRDGKIRRDEAPSADSFRAADADQDGSVSPVEFRRYLANRNRPAPAETQSSSAAPATPQPVEGVPTLKQLPDSDAVRDAAGTGQLFECVHVPGITDYRAGMNGFAIVDLNRDGRTDIVATTTPMDAVPGKPFRDTLRMLVNEGGFLDLLVTRSSQSRSRQGTGGNTLLLSDGAWDRFVHASATMGLRNEMAYNRQTCFGDVNGDGWLDVAIGCDNIKYAHGGVPHSRLYIFKPNGRKFEDGKFEDIGGSVMGYIEAPARFEAVSDKRVMLHGGRLSARVPLEEIGFTVEPPAAAVVDFGTEFSVDVEGGGSEVHVFDGLVRVHPGGANQRDASRSVNLQAFRAVRISDRAAELEDISIATERFIRNFDEPRLNYARAMKRLSPLVHYRMPIRDRGLVSEPPEYSGAVLTGEGKRPPHARGVFIGGSLRVGADSTGRGGRVESPPTWSTGQFSLTVFVYLETPAQNAIVATNLNGERGNFGLSLDEHGMLQAAIRSKNGDVSSIAGGSVLPQKTWRHIVVTADGEQLQFYEDGKLAASAP